MSDVRDEGIGMKWVPPHAVRERALGALGKKERLKERVSAFACLSCGNSLSCMKSGSECNVEILDHFDRVFTARYALRNVFTV